MERSRLAWATRLLLVIRYAFRDVVKNGLLASPLVPNRLRPYILRPFGVLAIGASIAPHVFIGSGVLEIGPDSVINYDVLLDAVAGILLGAHVKVGPRATFITQTHRIGPTEATRTDRGPGSTISLPIVVGDNVWIGAGATVLPGVEIGNGTVIAAGAVVTSSCKPNCLYGGVPARLIRELPV